MRLDDSLIAHHKKMEQLFCAAVFLSPDVVRQECGWLDATIFLDKTLSKFWQGIKDGLAPIDAALDQQIYSKLMDWSRDVMAQDASSFAREIADDHYKMSVATGLSTAARQLAENDVLALRETLADLNKSAPDITDTARTAIDIGLDFNARLFDKPDVIRFGIGALDSATGGIDRKTLTLLGGRPGAGKSTLSVQIARNVVAQGKKALVFALEQSEGMLWTKMACGDERYDYRRIKSGQASEQELQKIAAKSVALIDKYKDRLLIDDRSRKTSDMIWAGVARHRPDIFIVDHIGWVHGKEERLIERLGTISRTAKEIAKEMNCVALYVTQLNRAVEGRDNKRPMLSDLRDSGELEQNADQVIMLYRDDYYNNKNKPITERSLTELEVVKYRDGVSGVVAYLDFIPIAQWFFAKGENQ